MSTIKTEGTGNSTMDKEIWKKPKICSNIGGQALIEGVMMRGNDKVAVSVRKSTGEIHTDIKSSVPLTKKNRFFGLPFIRGGVSFIDSMIVGIRTLLDSAELVDLGEEEEKESKFDIWMKKKLGDKYLSYLLYFSVVLAMAFSIAVFVLLPNAVVSFLRIDKSTFGGSLLASTLEGLIRVGLFILYVWLVSKNKDIKRVFQYHGAEHKTIYAYENDEDLTLENVKKHTTLHPRCGTTFVFIVLIISSLIFAFTGWHNRFVNLLIRLALLPFIAGISYEVFKLSARTDSKFIRIISVPGLLLQKITTSEPDDSMLEVAIASLKAVLPDQPIPESQC